MNDNIYFYRLSQAESQSLFTAFTESTGKVKYYHFKLMIPPAN